MFNPMKKLSIIGMGLIGSSFAHAIKFTQRCQEIIGFDNNLANLQKASALKIIDRYETDIKKVVTDVDLIVIAVPVNQIADVFKQITPLLNHSTIITDTGSTKVTIINQAKTILQNHYPQFVPGHPLAGSEKSGISTENAALFRDKRVLLTPTIATQLYAIDSVKQLWESIGANVEIIDAVLHDKILAATSHLPHALAFAFMNHIAKQQQVEHVLDYTGTGFRDFSRIAAADPNVWKDIFISNKDNVLKETTNFIKELELFINALKNEDSEYLIKSMQIAKDVRLSLDEDKLTHV